MVYSPTSLLVRQSLKQSLKVTFTPKGYPAVKIPFDDTIEYDHYYFLLFIIFQTIITIIYHIFNIINIKASKIFSP